MRISHKMILIFSIMMITAVTVMSGYSARINLQGSSAFTHSRFLNMGSIMSRAIEEQIAMMDLAMEELLDNTTFMAALNQLVRDDSADGKMANAARNILLQQLYRSPMVESFYCVSFYDLEGAIVTSRFQEEGKLETGTEDARQVIAALPWLRLADTEPGRRHILSPHLDSFSTSHSKMVYGIVRAVTFHGRQLGYIEISNELAELTEIMDMVDDVSLLTQAVFDDGTVFYSCQGLDFIYPTYLTENAMNDYVDQSKGIHHSVMRVHNDWLGLNLFLAQDYSAIRQRNLLVLWDSTRMAIYITLPTLGLIVFVSLKLTRSTRKLTKKVRQIPAEHGFDSEALKALTETVTSSNDAEVYELEQVLNTTMLRLHESSMNELSLREGTLQAQLSAMQAQINPHFVYNTLNIISAKSMESGNLEVIEICDQFAQLLRYATDTRSRTATLAEEIENVRNYLLLAKARYEEDLEFSIDIPDNLSPITVPRLTLQPIVENALTHGFNGQNMKRCLSITGTMNQRQLILEVRDNGTGFTTEVLAHMQEKLKMIEAGEQTVQQSGSHIGLANTCLRLYYYSHGTMHVSIRNEDGAVVRLTLPC